MYCSYCELLGADRAVVWALLVCIIASVHLTKVKTTKHYEESETHIFKRVYFRSFINDKGSNMCKYIISNYWGTFDLHNCIAALGERQPNHAKENVFLILHNIDSRVAK